MLIDLFRAQCTCLYMCTGTGGGSQSRGKKDENFQKMSVPPLTLYDFGTSDTFQPFKEEPVLMLNIILCVQ